MRNKNTNINSFYTFSRNIYQYFFILVARIRIEAYKKQNLSDSISDALSH